MTEDNKKEFMEDPNVCPYCKSFARITKEFGIADIQKPVVYCCCLSCEKQWFVNYKMSEIQCFDD